MPLVTTGATVPGLYSHIAHSVDKDEAEIPNPFKGANQSKPEVEVNLKQNLKVTDKTHQKTKRQMNHTLIIGGSRGGGHAWCIPPYGTQFFHFRIHFHRKVPTSEVHAPLMGACPPYGKSWICHCL